MSRRNFFGKLFCVAAGAGAALAVSTERTVKVENPIDSMTVEQFFDEHAREIVKIVEGRASAIREHQAGPMITIHKEFLEEEARLISGLIEQNNDYRAVISRARSVGAFAVTGPIIRHLP